MELGVDASSHIEDEQNKFCMATGNQQSAQKSIKTIKPWPKMAKD